IGRHAGDRGVPIAVPDAGAEEDTPMTTLPDELAATVRGWIAADPCAADRAELQELLDTASGAAPAPTDPYPRPAPPDAAARERAAAALSEQMGDPLTFGTAGLRGPL